MHITDYESMQFLNMTKLIPQQLEQLVQVKPNYMVNDISLENKHDK